MPEGYGDLVGLIGAEVRTTRLRAARAANTELNRMNWRTGRLILERQQIEPWGSAVIRQLAADLRREFPDMTELSATNLQYMRAFAAAWTTEPTSPQPVGKLPWGHVRTLLDQLDDLNLRDWYAERDVGNGWSRQVLEHHIATGLTPSYRCRPSNSPNTSTEVHADQAQEIVRRCRGTTGRANGSSRPGAGRTRGKRRARTPRGREFLHGVTTGTVEKLRGGSGPRHGRGPTATPSLTAAAAHDLDLVAVAPLARAGVDNPDPPLCQPGRTSRRSSPTTARRAPRHH